MRRFSCTPRILAAIWTDHRSLQLLQQWSLNLGVYLMQIYICRFPLYEALSQLRVLLTIAPSHLSYPEGITVSDV